MSDIPVEIPEGVDEAPDADELSTIEDELNTVYAGPDEDITVKRSQVARWTSEIGKYRKSYGEAARTWKDVPTGDVQALRSFYHALQTGNADSIKQWGDYVTGVLQQLTPAEQKEVNAEIKEIAKETGQTQAEVKASLTPEDIKKILADEFSAREAKQREEAEVAKATQLMNDTAAALAEEHGIGPWATPGTPLYGMLLNETSRVMASSPKLGIEQAMQEAAKGIVAQLDELRNAELSKKKATAGAGAKPVPQKGVAPAAGQNTPRTLEDAGAAARERLMRAFGG